MPQRQPLNNWLALAAALLVGLQSASSPAAITDNLRLYLPLDSSEADASGNAVAMTNMNGVTFTTAGQIGNSATFANLAGVDTTTAQYLHTTNELSLGTSDFTVSFWVKADSTLGVNAGDPTFVSNKNWNSGNNPGWGAFRGTVDGGGGWQWNFTAPPSGRSDFDPAKATSNVEDSIWHHIAISHNRQGFANHYFDGTLIGSSDISGSAGNSIDTGLPTGIGVDGDLGTEFSAFINAQMDDVAIWDRALFGNAISAIYDAGVLGNGVTTVNEPGIPVLGITINRDNGQISIVNDTGFSQAIKGYSIRSEDGTLSETNAASSFLSVGDANWVKFTASGSTSDLSEGHLTTDTFGTGTAFTFGNGSWSKYYDEGDISFEYIDGFGEIQTGLIDYIGTTQTTPFDKGDLDFDGDIDSNDWLQYVGGLGSDLSGMSVAQAYPSGDLNGDLLNNHADFLEFKSLFEAANPLQSFEDMVAGIPEPTSFVLAMVGVVGFLGATHRRGEVARE